MQVDRRLWVVGRGRVQRLELKSSLPLGIGIKINKGSSQNQVFSSVTFAVFRRGMGKQQKNAAACKIPGGEDGYLSQCLKGTPSILTLGSQLSSGFPTSDGINHLKALFAGGPREEASAGPSPKG